MTDDKWGRSPNKWGCSKFTAPPISHKPKSGQTHMCVSVVSPQNTIQNNRLQCVFDPNMGSETGSGALVMLLSLLYSVCHFTAEHNHNVQDHRVFLHYIVQYLLPKGRYKAAKDYFYSRNTQLQILQTNWRPLKIITDFLLISILSDLIKQHDLIPKLCFKNNQTTLKKAHADTFWCVSNASPNEPIYRPA